MHTHAAVVALALTALLSAQGARGRVDKPTPDFAWPVQAFDTSRVASLTLSSSVRNYIP